MERKGRKWKRQRSGKGEDPKMVSDTKGLVACERQMHMQVFIGGWRLSVSFALALDRLWRHRIRAYTDTASRAYNEGSAPPLAKGCVGAGVARFYLRHSSAKGVRDEIYLRGNAVFVFSSVPHMHTRTYVFVLCMHSHTCAHRAQWRFSVVPPFKQAEEILRCTLVPVRSLHDATTLAS